MSGGAQLTIQNNQSIAGLTGASGNNIRNTTASNWTLTLTGGTNSYAGSLTETAAGFLSLSISGGTTALTGVNSYRGSTTVSGGTLSLGSNLASSGSVSVSGGGTLTSTVANVNLGLGATSMSSGAITPGGIGTVGSFTLANGQNFSTTGGTLNFDLSSASSFDKIIGAGAGAFSLANTTLALSGLISESGTYQIFSGFGGSNTVTGLTITGLSPGYSGSLSTAGLLTIVPEPSAFAMLLGAFAFGFAMLRRRPTAK
jgi:autotransporter-associated beta strand protein